MGNRLLVKHILEVAFDSLSEKEQVEAFWIAVERGFTDVAKILFSKGLISFLLSFRTWLGRSPFLFAAEKGNLELVRHILELNPDSINSEDRRRFNALDNEIFNSWPSSRYFPVLLR